MPRGMSVTRKRPSAFSQTVHPVQTSRYRLSNCCEERACATQPTPGWLSGAGAAAYRAAENVAMLFEHPGDLTGSNHSVIVLSLS